MRDKLKGVVIAAGAIAVVAFAGGAVATATGTKHHENGDHDKGIEARRDHDGKHITGNALVKARKVALARVGGGKVTDSEVGDEEGYYEVEVERNDGARFDVHLDRNFNVIDSSPDGGGDKQDASNN